jgi:hypothetical protein
MARITITSWQNRFAIDNLLVFDFLREGLGYLDIVYDPALQKIEKIQPGGEPNSHTIDAPDIVDSLRVICYWDSENDPGIRLELVDPNGNLVYEKESEQTPILVPVLSDPMAGNWKIDISSLKDEGDAYPYAIIGAFAHEPLVDCYLGGDDIWSDPQEPKMGDKLWIVAQIHCGDQFSEPVEQVLVRNFLGDPIGGDQIGRDAYALGMEPGSVDTVFFYFDTAKCEGISPCLIYVAIDPESDIEEYSEDNNIAFKEIVFSP